MIAAAAFLPVSVWALFLQHSPAAPPPAKPLSGFPFANETLNYSVNWPTGLSLGDAHLRAAKEGNQWQFELSLSASVPAFGVSDHYRSTATTDLCSLELEKQTKHGKRSAHERTVFDYKQGSATRKTLVEGGGHTDISISSCARDGLDFVYFLRRELGQGRVPPADSVLFGASYAVHLEYTGEQDIILNKKHYQADRVVVNLDGPASNARVEIFFDRDPARTPLIVRVPLPLGTLLMELVR